MKINTSKRYINQDPIASHLVKHLHDNQDNLNLQESNIYFEYPLYKDIDGDLVISNLSPAIHTISTT